VRPPRHRSNRLCPLGLADHGVGLLPFSPPPHCSQCFFFFSSFFFLLWSRSITQNERLSLPAFPMHRHVARRIASFFFPFRAQPVSQCGGFFLFGGRVELLIQRCPLDDPVAIRRLSFFFVNVAGGPLSFFFFSGLGSYCPAAFLWRRRRGTSFLPDMAK